MVFQALDLLVESGDLLLKHLLGAFCVSLGRFEGAFKLNNLLFEAFVLSDLVVKVLLQLSLRRLQLRLQLGDFDFQATAFLLRLC